MGALWENSVREIAPGFVRGHVVSAQGRDEVIPVYSRTSYAREQVDLTPLIHPSTYDTLLEGMA